MCIRDSSWPWLLLGNGFSHEVWAVQWYEYTGIFGEMCIRDS